MRRWTRVSLVPAIALLAGLAAAAGGAAQTEAEEEPAYDIQTVEVRLTEWSLGFQEVPITDEKARFAIENAGTTSHAFEIEGEIGGREFEVASPVLTPGAATEFLVELPPGTYEVYCPLPGHEEKGMQATVRVTAGE